MLPMKKTSDPWTFKGDPFFQRRYITGKSPLPQQIKSSVQLVDLPFAVYGMGFSHIQTTSNDYTLMTPCINCICHQPISKKLTSQNSSAGSNVKSQQKTTNTSRDSDLYHLPIWIHPSINLKLSSPPSSKCPWSPHDGFSHCKRCKSKDVNTIGALESNSIGLYPEEFMWNKNATQYKCYSLKHFVFSIFSGKNRNWHDLAQELVTI